jgi:hypothetical protein
MSRFVLRYSGSGAVSTDRALQSAARAGVRVLDASGPMLLVECDAAEAKTLRSALPDWNVVAEKEVVARPRQPRPRVRRRAA